MTTIDFSKFHGLVPAVVQDAATRDVLMVGFMNQEAWDVTRRTGFVTFFSRTRNTLWTKGETSGNRLQVSKAGSTATRTPSWSKPPASATAWSATRERAPASANCQ